MSERQAKWDTRYLELATQIGSWSKDPSTKVGAVVVCRDNRIRGTGFNGFRPGGDDSPGRYEDRTYKYRHIVHAEVNALASVSPVFFFGATLYTSFPCCPDCAKYAIDCGVKRVVTPPLPIDLSRSVEWVENWSKWSAEAAALLAASGIEMVQVVVRK